MTRTPKRRAEQGVDHVIAAAEAARKLSHVPLRQGRSFECWQCPASGAVDQDGVRIGNIFTEACTR